MAMWFTFGVIVYLTILVNMDHGSIPAATDQIQKDLNITIVELGTVGSAVYAGLTLGSFICGFVFSKWNEKVILILVCVGLCGPMTLFAFAWDEKCVIFGTRFLTGFLQVFISVYAPVWIDTKGSEQWKTLQMSVLSMSSVVGDILGYILTALLSVFTTWRWSYMVQAIAFLPAAAVIFCLPSQSLRCKRLHHSNISNTVQRTKTSYLHLCRNGLYVVCILCISCNYYIITGVLFWGTNYLHIVLQVDKPVIFPTFVTLTISAPMLGVILGGSLIHRIGGYTSRKALYLLSFLGALAAISAIPIPLVNSLLLFSIFMWFFLFFGASIMPGTLGVMISSVDQDSKYKANGLCNIANNLLGYLPSPFIYGLICEYTGENESPYGMMANMYMSALAMFLMLLALCIRKKKNYEHSEVSEPLLRRSSL